MTKVYVSSEGAVPDDVPVRKDEHGVYYETGDVRDRPFSDDVVDRVDETRRSGDAYRRSDMKRTPGGGSPPIPQEWYNLEPSDLSTMDERELTELREYLMEIHSDARGGRRSREDVMPHYLTDEDEMMREVLDVVRMVDDELYERDMKSKDVVFDSDDIERIVISEIGSFVESGSVSEEEVIEGLERVKRRVRQSAPETYYRSDEDAVTDGGSRVYVGSRQDVPQGRQARTDKEGSVFYTLSQEPKEASNAVAQAHREEYPEELPVPDNSDVAEKYRGAYSYHGSEYPMPDWADLDWIQDGSVKSEIEDLLSSDRITEAAQKAVRYLRTDRSQLYESLSHMADARTGRDERKLAEKFVFEELDMDNRSPIGSAISTILEQDVYESQMDALGGRAFARARKSSATLDERQEKFVDAVVRTVSDVYTQRDLKEIIESQRPSTWREVAEALVEKYSNAVDNSSPREVREAAVQRVLDRTLSRFVRSGGPEDWYEENVMGGSDPAYSGRGYPYTSEYRPSQVEGVNSLNRSEYGADARLAELGFQPSYRGAEMAQCLECGEHMSRTQLDIHMRECPNRTKDDDVDPDEIEDPDDDGVEEFDIEGDPDEIEDPDNDGEEEMDVDPSEDDEKEDPCWDGYEMIGTKVVDGEEVPNCVPKSDSKSVAKYTEDTFASEVVVRDATDSDALRGNYQVLFGSFDDRSDAERKAEEVADVLSVGSKRKSVTKQELREGLEWSEKVEIIDIDEEENEVTMEDQLTGSTWSETVDDIEAKLEAINERDHGWLYDMIEGQYPEIDSSAAHEVLHEFDRLADDPSEEVLENMARVSKTIQKYGNRLYIAEQEDVPSQMEVEFDGEHYVVETANPKQLAEEIAPQGVVRMTDYEIEWLESPEGSEARGILIAEALEENNDLRGIAQEAANDMGRSLESLVEPPIDAYFPTLSREDKSVAVMETKEFVESMMNGRSGADDRYGYRRSRSVGKYENDRPEEVAHDRVVDRVDLSRYAGNCVTNEYLARENPDLRDVRDEAVVMFREEVSPDIDAVLGNDFNPDVVSVVKEKFREMFVEECEKRHHDMTSGSPSTLVRGGCPECGSDLIREGECQVCGCQKSASKASPKDRAVRDVRRVLNAAKDFPESVLTMPDVRNAPAGDDTLRSLLYSIDATLRNIEGSMDMAPANSPTDATWEQLYEEAQQVRRAAEMVSPNDMDAQSVLRELADKAERLAEEGQSERL